MPLDERESAYFWDMFSTAREVQQIIGTMSLEAFQASSITIRATERCIEIIGEAARRVSRETQQIHTNIPWSDIIGQRNILAHKYGQIDHELLYKTATQDVPKLAGVLKQLFGEQ